VKILGIDTALGACSAAVLDGDAVLAHRHEEMQRGHAEALAPMVEALMREAGLPLKVLDRLAVTTGPGTFTGQRVGLAFVRGLAVALNCPAVGVTTLDVMAEESLRREAAPWAAAVIDAKRGEVYLGARSAEGATLFDAGLLPLGEAARVLTQLAMIAGRTALLAGSGADAIAPLVPEAELRPRISSVRQPDAVFVARLGASAPPPAGPPRPLYLRAPDARLPGAP
jgi:tRNA threonylcarbamoyladenosine biosynthesis protein TsaB